MKIKTYIFSLLSFSVHAGTMSDILNFDFPYVASFSIGPTWANPGQQQTLNLSSQLEKTYTTNQGTNTLVDGEVFLGMRRDLPYALFAHLGIAGALTSQAGVSGEIWDDANSQFNNYTYGYHIQHGHVALKAKVFKEINYPVLPWISGSIGVGFNRSHGFHNTPLISEAVIQNNFMAYTQTSFTYTLGAGVQKILNQHWQAGLGYEFADWGQSRLNRASGQTLGQGLSLSHLYTNGLMFNLTYIA